MITITQPVSLLKEGIITCPNGDHYSLVSKRDRVAPLLALISHALSPHSLALNRLGAGSACHGSQRPTELYQWPTQDSVGERVPALTRSAGQERARTMAILITGLRVGQRRPTSHLRRGLITPHGLGTLLSITEHARSRRRLRPTLSYAERGTSTPSTRANTKPSLDARRVCWRMPRLTATFHAIRRILARCVLHVARRATLGWTPQAAANGLEHFGEGIRRRRESRNDDGTSLVSYKYVLVLLPVS
jgi:hypothetical protein